MIEFVIREPNLSRYGLNRLYAGLHWARRKEHADYWHSLVGWRLRELGAAMAEGPVFVEFYFNTQMDADNHGYLVKLIIDGMKGVIIRDDSREYVAGYSVRFHDGKGILVRVRGTQDE